MGQRLFGAPNRAIWPKTFGARRCAHCSMPVLRAPWLTKKNLSPPRPVDEVIHPWLIRLCSVFLDQGTAYWPMPNREKGFYESVRMLLSRRGGMFPKYLGWTGRGISKAGASFLFGSGCGPGLPGQQVSARRLNGLKFFRLNFWHSRLGGLDAQA